MLNRIFTVRRLRRLIRSRLFAVAALAAFSVLAVSAVSAQGKTVRVIDGETTKSLYTLRTEPDEILALAGVELLEGDEYTFSGFSGKQAEIEVHRAVEVTVVYASERRILRLANATAAQAVEFAGYKMSEHDYLNVAPAAALTDGMEILVSNVDYVYVTEEKPLTYATKTVYSDTLAKNKVVKKNGAEGLELLTYKQKKVNGEVVSSELVSSETVREPVAAQKIIGTKAEVKAAAKTPAAAVTTTAGIKTVSRLIPKAPIPLDAKGRPVSYKKLITGKATAYSPNDGHTTATGKAVLPGYIAVNPKIIPYGTKMYIRTPDGKYIYGYASAEDTGGFTKKGKIVADLFFSSYSEAIAFGVRNIEIYILD